MTNKPPARLPQRRRWMTLLLSLLTLPFVVIVLLGLEPIGVIPAEVNGLLQSMSRTLINLAAITAAVAVVIGIINLLRVHGGNLSRPSGLYSIFTLLGFFLVFGVWVAERMGVLNIAASGGTANLPVTSTLLDSVQISIESALSGILFFFLVYSAYRLMSRQVSVWSVLFLVTMLIVLIGALPVPGAGISFLATLRDWLLRVPVTAGTRGLLIGVALGVVVVGVRTLLGQDRTYRD